MENELIDTILQRMQSFLNYAQTLKLREILNEVLVPVEDSKANYSNEELFKAFLNAKHLEGLTDRSLIYYKQQLIYIFKDLKKNVLETTTRDLREFLSKYQIENNVNNVTLNNVRRVLNSFFTWLENENYIFKSPMRRIHNIKTDKIIKQPFDLRSINKMREYAKKEPRDLAIIDLLLSTGMRVGELVLLNKKDLDFNKKQCKVFGKGRKERICFFDERAKESLQNYLKTRTDKEEALFVNLNGEPKRRITIEAVGNHIRVIGRRCGIEKAHPHRFRRTLATMALDKGMPLEQVQKLLGHEEIGTTLIYANVKEANVKKTYRKIFDKDKDPQQEVS